MDSVIGICLCLLCHGLSFISAVLLTYDDTLILCNWISKVMASARPFVDQRSRKRLGDVLIMGALH